MIVAILMAAVWAGFTLLFELATAVARCVRWVVALW